MKRRYAALLALAALPTGCLAWDLLAPPEPLPLRLTITNPYDGELTVHSVAINGQARPLPGVEDGAPLRIAPRETWRGRFLVEIGGEWPVRVRMTLPSSVDSIEADGTMDARFEEQGLVCLMSVNLGDPIRPVGISDCFLDQDYDHAD